MSAVTQATSLIETITGVFFLGADREVTITTTDAVWLKKATIYQAVFQLDQAEIYSRAGVNRLSQDGVSVESPNALTFVLAPLAKRALGNCSWAKSGTLKVAMSDEPESEDFLVSDNHPWYPLGGV
jgi:hypothetical protein